MVDIKCLLILYVLNLTPVLINLTFKENPRLININPLICQNIQWHVV